MKNEYDIWSRGRRIVPVMKELGWPTYEASACKEFEGLEKVV